MTGFKIYSCYKSLCSIQLFCNCLTACLTWVLVIYSLFSQITTLDVLNSLRTNSLYEKCPYLEFFWSTFFRICFEYGEIWSISPYSVQMRMNADQKKSKYKHFLSSDWTSVHWTTRKLTDFYLMRIMGGCLMGSFMYFRLIQICIPFFKVWINGLNLIIWQTNDHKVKFCKNISVLKTYC